TRAREEFAREAEALVVSETETAKRYDRLMALGLTELERQQQRAALGDPEARDDVFGATLALASVASRAEQWSVAAALCEQAAGLGGGGERAEAARAAVETARTLVLKEHGARVMAIPRDAASGELARRPSGVADAKYVLVGLHEPQTVALVGSALDGVTKKL